MIGNSLPTVFVGGTTLGILLNPNATPISSAISQACNTSALIGETVTLNF